MLMALGMFQFELGTLPYQELVRRTDWRHARTERFGARPATQFLGPGDDSITLSGVLLPEVAGRHTALASLREMAGEGEAWPLVDAQGNVLGSFTILAIDERQSDFLDNGVPRKADFGVDLGRVE